MVAVGQTAIGGETVLAELAAREGVREPVGACAVRADLGIVANVPALRS